jgi:hypothetical protein
MAEIVDAPQTAPPAGRALLAAVGGMKPVAPRVPRRALLVVLAVGVVWPMLAVLHRTRADLPFLPLAWVAAMAVAWTAGVVVPLVAAILPRHGEVLADGARAARVAAASASLLVLLGLVATVDAPGKTSSPPTFLGGWWHCASFVLKVTVPVLVAGALALRHLYPTGSWRIAAAIGAGGGALGGLTLHFICGYGGGLHVGLAHAGGVVLAALLGALVLPPFLRFRS